MPAMALYQSHLLSCCSAYVRSVCLVAEKQRHTASPFGKEKEKKRGHSALSEMQNAPFFSIVREKSATRNNCGFTRPRWDALSFAPGPRDRGHGSEAAGER